VGPWQVSVDDTVVREPSVKKLEGEEAKTAFVTAKHALATLRRRPTATRGE